jgi:hypothetical protein
MLDRPIIVYASRAECGGGDDHPGGIYLPLRNGAPHASARPLLVHFAPYHFTAVLTTAATRAVPLFVAANPDANAMIAAHVGGGGAVVADVAGVRTEEAGETITAWEPLPLRFSAVESAWHGSAACRAEMRELGLGVSDDGFFAHVPELPPGGGTDPAFLQAFVRGLRERADARLAAEAAAAAAAAAVTAAAVAAGAGGGIAPEL